MKRLLSVCFVLLVLGAAEVMFAQTKPVSPEVAAAMLKKANVKDFDAVIVLGSGNGTIAIAAAKDFGASKVVAVESDAALVKEAQAAAEKAGVAGKITFLTADPATADLAGMSVAAVNLPADVNLKLAKKIQYGLEPDSRVVAVNANMGDDWWPDATIDVGGTPVYFWTIPYR